MDPPIDDSDQDFVDLCSKFLRRNRKKLVDQRLQNNSSEQHSSQTAAGEKRRKKTKKEDITGSHGSTAGNGKQLVCRGPTSGPSVSAEGGTRAKDKVLRKMQQFKRANPQKMVFGERNQPTEFQDKPEPDRTEVHPDSLHSDEALAMRLQQQLDGEARLMGLEDDGLFFCQLCHKDLSHMTHEGRTQHINRCLDEREGHAAAPQPPAVLECPICGKRFKSLKSRSTHLKRCSMDMGVPPAVLMQALQRQAEETQSTQTSNQISQIGGNKRKGSKSNLPGSKKPRKKVVELDEDTMVAMALSSSLLEQDKQKEAESEGEIVASNTFKSPKLKWRPPPDKGRGKKKKCGMSRPPPLLLFQDAEAIVARIQERVSALLLHSRAPSPPTPTQCPSSLSGWSGAAPLWQKSALLTDEAFCITDFYTPELRDFIVPQESPMSIARLAASADKLGSTMQPMKTGTPVTTSSASIAPSSSHTGHSSPAVSSPGTGQLPGCSQALRDLMELADDGMTLTQYGYTTTGLSKDQQSSTSHQTTNFNLSGFAPEVEKEPNNHYSSGFFSDDNIHKQPLRRPVYKQEEEESKHQSLSLSKLALDLGTMVNNPQLSDVQLQVDSGEVYFAHSFIVYARCPLLAEMIHESGFGVQEEGVPAAQMVLLNEVPGQAVFALLQYLYTARCTFPSSLQPHILELASRFDLKDLQDLCQPQDESLLEGEDAIMGHNPNNQTDQDFIDLLRSMWNDKDKEDEGADENNLGFDHSKDMDDQSDDLQLGDREIHDDQVNEEELVEIYEFAATQKKREEEDRIEEEIHVNDQEWPGIFPTEKEDPLEIVDRVTDTSLEASYNRLFSQSWGDYEEKELSTLPLDPESKCTSRTKQRQSIRLLSSEMSRRTLPQLSASVIDKLSLSPLPISPNMPVPGLSPGLSPSDGNKRNTEILNVSAEFRDESKGSRAICVSISPQKSPKKDEPELVVLSDCSSDDTKIDLTQSSPSPENIFTNIKEQPILEACDQSIEEMDGQLSASPVDCSAEVSWLIPSTPVQHRKSVRTSSSQTISSICRTQLFPRGDGDSSHSPKSTAEDLLHTNSSEGSVSKMATCTGMSSTDKSHRRGSLDLTKEKNLDLSGFAVPLSPAKHLTLSNHSLSHLNSSKQNTSLHFPACSSTPVHTELTKPPTQPQSSPFSAENVSTEKVTEVPSYPSPENAEVHPSFHLSPLPEHSSSSQGTSKTNNMSYNKLSEDGDGDVRNEMTSLERNEPHKDISEGGGECSFRQSFMDEPPIAFNDSWGLDACAENPACFSLKLEDSGESVQEEDKIKTANLQSTTTFSTPNRKSLHIIISPTFSPPVTAPPDVNNSLLDKIWDSWDEENEEKHVAPSLSERLKSPVQHRTPVSIFKKHQKLVPITPMPHYSDMDTPDLKNKLNKFGVRPLPKRQMILKLKEIHQYTHKVVSSDSEGEAPPVSQPTAPPVPCAQTSQFKQPKTAAPFAQQTSRDDDPDALSASQGSNTSSTAESERSNPEIVQLSDGDSDSDGGISASQAATRLQDRLQAVRAFILSNSTLYNQILQYQPLVLSQFQQQLKAAGIRLGVSKLADYLDSQCITFTTAKPGQSAPNRRRVKRTKGTAEGGVRRKKASTAVH